MADDKKAATVSVIVARDYWDANAERVVAGTVIEVTVEQALDGIETGALARVKD